MKFYKPLSTLFLMSGLAFALPLNAEVVNLSTPSTSLILDAEKGGSFRFLYYGDKLSASDIDNLTVAGAANRDAYPAYGNYPQGEAALSVTQPDGNMTLDLEVADIKTSADKADGSTVTTVSMRDKVYPLSVNANYRTWPEEAVIETWVDITNNGKGSVTLNRFMSGYLPVRYGNVWLSSLYGSWANEGRLNQEPLRHGVKRIRTVPAIPTHPMPKSCCRSTGNRWKTPVAQSAQPCVTAATTNCSLTLTTAIITICLPA